MHSKSGDAWTCSAQGNCGSLALPQEQQGQVVGIEHIQELVDWSISNVAKEQNAAVDRMVLLKHGDGRLGIVCALCVWPCVCVCGQVWVFLSVFSFFFLKGA